MRVKRSYIRFPVLNALGLPLTASWILLNSVAGTNRNSAKFQSTKIGPWTLYIQYVFTQEIKKGENIHLIDPQRFGLSAHKMWHLWHGP